MASALFKKFQDEQAKKDAEYKAWEADQWKQHGALWEKEGYKRLENPNSAWGSTWSYIKPENPPKDEVEQESTLAKAKREGTVSLLIGRTQPEEEVTPEIEQTPLITEHEFRNNAHFRNHHFLKDNANITIDGKTYPIMVTNGLYNNNYGVENDRTYAFNPETGLIRAVFENFTGMPHSSWATNSEWITPGWMAGPEYEWKKANPMPAMRSPLGGGFTPEYEQWLSNYKQAKATGFKKQGGTMNKVKYFQQGGSIKEQLRPLVIGVLSKDPKSTLKLQQIVKQNPQIMKVVEEIAAEEQAKMQSQATSAKWGSKLQYIRSLKFAKGGKTCPACMGDGGKSPEKSQNKNQKMHVNANDTVHVKGQPKSLTNSDGSRVDKRFPAYTAKDYQNDKKTKDGQKRRLKADLVSSEKCGGAAPKVKKHYFGGWL